MNETGRSMPATVAVAVILLGGVLAGVPRGFCEPPNAEPIPAPQVGSAVRSAFRPKGTDLCVKCHRSEQGEWCDVATTSAWRHDAHSRAHLALSPANERTRVMEQSLGIKAAETASCVACHTHSIDEPPIEEETDVLHAGISCETCHGTASGYLEPHMEKSWRFLSSSEKRAFGMHDLRNPVEKARNCLSCHLGDVATGRIITHQMYAAGHPPLPAFEMEAFSAGMGPHWKRVWEKSPRIRRLAAEAHYETEGASELERSLVGTLVALRETARLVNDYAGEAENDPKDRPWPELALYDCQACHHELVVPSWRQEAGYGRLVPGRPSLVRWPRRLAAVAFEEAGMPTDVDALLDPFVAVLNRRPFGTTDGMRQAADAGVESFAQIDRAIEALSRRRRDETLAGRMQTAAERIAAAGREVGDFESARLLAWALTHGLADADAWPQDMRARKIAELSKLLSLEFPTSAYPVPPSPEKPFWQTSLSAAPTADIGRVREAFQLPPADTPPPGLEFIPPPAAR